MKKLILTVSIVFGTMVSNAAYLFWQVSSTDADSTFEINGVATSWDRAKLYATKDGSSILIGEESGTQNYIGDTEQGATIVVPTGNIIVSDLGTYTGSSGYSYYVELWNSSSVVARSDTYTHTQIDPSSAYSDTGTLTSSMMTVPQLFTAWHAGGYRAVPEPTSGLMLLLGAAMLGLKRKNRSIA